MSSRNGYDSEADLPDRFYTLLARLNATLESLLEHSRQSLAQHGDDSETLRAEIRGVRDLILETKHHVNEARGGLDRLREETNPRIRLPPAPQDKRKDEGFEITDEQVRLPRPWATGLLKAAMSAGGGALLLRAVQWLAAGH